MQEKKVIEMDGNFTRNEYTGDFEIMSSSGIFQLTEILNSLEDFTRVKVTIEVETPNEQRFIMRKDML